MQPVPPSNIHGCSAHTFLHQKTSIHIIVIHILQHCSYIPTSVHIIVIHTSTHQYRNTFYISSSVYITVIQYTHQYSNTSYNTDHCSYIIPHCPMILHHTSFSTLFTFNREAFFRTLTCGGWGSKVQNFFFLLRLSTAIHNLLVKIQIQLHILMFMWHI